VSGDPIMPPQSQKNSDSGPARGAIPDPASSRMGPKRPVEELGGYDLSFDTPA
jgi:hypothetical protein